MEEGHKNHFPNEREPRTWHDPIWSHLCGTWEAPCAVWAGREWSGGQTEYIITGCSHREDSHSDNLRWKESHNPGDRHCPPWLCYGDSRWRDAHVQRTHEERKPQNQVWCQVSTKAYCTTEIWSEEGAGWGLITNLDYKLGLINYGLTLDDRDVNWM